MSDQDMFNEKEDNNQENNSSDPATSSENPFADRLMSIKNENGEPKYKDVESALEALKHSQDFIKTLQTEKKTSEQQLQEIQAELEKRKSVEEVVQSLTQNNQPKTTESETPAQRQGLDEDRVREYVEGLLQQKTAEQQETENLNKVTSTLYQQHGDQAAKLIKDRAKELNTTPTELEKIARTNPNMALSLLGGGSITSQTPTMSSNNPPRHVQKSNEMPRPEKKLLTTGASKTDIQDAWEKSKQYVYNKFDVEK